MNKIFMIMLSIMSGMIGFSFMTSVDNIYKIDELKDRVLMLENRVEFLRAHMETLDQNDALFFDAIEKLNQNDKVIACQIDLSQCGWWVE